MLDGWTVARAIPYETLIGLTTGKYKLYGGVVRWAAGTAKGGQIVRHLIPAVANPFSAVPSTVSVVSDLAANAQLVFLQKATNEIKELTQFNTQQLSTIASGISNLTQSTQQILNLATGTAILSGLSLGVSAIGFMAINKKLNIIDQKLKEIQKDVQAIKYFLESSERAKLFAALNALLKIDTKTPPEHCHTILHTSKNTLAEINMRYRELLSEANTIETAMANEEYFSLTALAQARCTAELGMLDIAYKEIQEMNAFWQIQAHRISKEILIGEYPERFLATDFVEDVSVSELAQWLDFVYEEEKGLVWIDEMRKRINESWYSKNWFSMADSGLNKNIGIGLEKEQQMLMPSLRKLISRSSVFEGYMSQYELLEEQKLKPSEFEQKLACLPESSVVNGYIILEPAQTMTK